MTAAMVVMLVLALVSSLALLFTSKRRQPSMIDRIDALLPQTQCGRCTYSGCRPYATAITAGEADINQCPPGGMDTVIALSRLLAREPRPVDPRFGVVPAKPPVAWIDESACIGCTKCIQACPVDAIVGASKFMHTVIADHCTGCELCIPPCPVDCIEMHPAAGPRHFTQSTQRSQRVGK